MNTHPIILGVLCFIFVTALLFGTCYAFITTVFLCIRLMKMLRRCLNRIARSLQNLHVKQCHLLIDWERLFLVTLSTCLMLVLVMAWIGRYKQPADPELGFDHWFFEGLRVVFAVLEGDSADFRSHASFCPPLAAMLSILVPLSAVGTVLTLLWSYLPHHVPCFNRVWYVFSELEPNSIRMANSLQMNQGDDTSVFIFLRTRRDKLNPEMQAQLRKLNYYLYPQDETAFLSWRWRGSRILRFFFLSENTDKNFTRMKGFLENVGEKALFTPMSVKLPDGQFQHELYLLSETESAPMLIDYLRGNLQDAKNPHTFCNTELRLLDRFRAVSYDLLRKKPLLTKPPEEKDLNILVLGFGRIGREFFRAASSVWLTHGCTLHFTLCDLQVQCKLNAFTNQCPELAQSVHYQQQELDAESDQMASLIQENDYHYIVVALGDDERNIRVASWLMRYYRKNCWKNPASNLPQICVNIEDTIKHEYVKLLWKTDNGTGRSLHVFGGLDQAFSKSVLMPESLWLAARWIHRKLNNLPADTLPMAWSEYQRRSSIACAAHAEYHSTVAPISSYPLKDLIDTEHNRWMAYVRSEGMQKADLALVNTYYSKLGNTHVDVLGRLTPCLVDASELEKVQASVDELRTQASSLQCDHSTVKPFRKRDEFVVCNASIIREIAKGENSADSDAYVGVSLGDQDKSHTRAACAK